MRFFHYYMCFIKLIFVWFFIWFHQIFWKFLVTSKNFFWFLNTAQRKKSSIKDFFSFLRIWSHLLKKSLMENLIFCSVKLELPLIHIFQSSFVVLKTSMNLKSPLCLNALVDAAEMNCLIYLIKTNKVRDWRRMVMG